jgi:hypothetical protein
MRTPILAAALLACVGVASAGVTVKYEDPSKFQDMPHNDRDRDQVLKDLSEHFAKLGKKLPAGQDLIITVKDIDLAGREEPTRRRIEDIRILRGGADWPSMQIQYTLQQNGQVIKSGDEHVANMMYLNRINRYDNDSLRYEKQMLDDWFREKFEPPKVSRADH